MTRPDHIQALVDQRDPSLLDGASRPKAGVSLHPETIREELVLCGARRELAELLRAEAMSDLDAWAQAAIEAHLSIAEIARLSGVSRQTLHARVP